MAPLDTPNHLMIEPNPRFAPDRATLENLSDLQKRILWLSTWTIHHANHLRAKGEVKVGGHQASCASSAALMTALYFHALRPQDRVAVKPHASPVFHAIQYLMGNQTQEKLENFRGLGGAQSYPSRTKDTDDVDFSTGSVGLGPAMAMFASLTQDYTRRHFETVRERDQGRLAEWDGENWTILEKKPFVCTAGREGFGGTTFASGWDQASAILKVYTDADKTWRTYRLPKSSHCFDHKWQTEWPRIREVEHERLLMDHHGMFYELSPWAYNNRIWGVRPISTHLWVHGDFCTYRGMLVLGADNASNPGSAEPQSGLWFGKTDDLWKLGKPTGWGGPWWDEAVKAGEASDPYLMTGFDKKCIHIKHDADKQATFDIQVDFMGCGEFVTYAKMVAPPKGYVQHTFPEGFSAHWVRVVPDTDCTATAQLFYT